MEEQHTIKEIPVSTLPRIIKQLIRFLFSQWLILGAVFILAFWGGVLKAWLKEPIYTAEMMFSSESDKANQMGGYSGLAAQFGIDLGGGSATAFQGDNLIEFLKTRTLIERTLLSPYKNKLLIDDYLLNHNLRKQIDKNPALNNIVFEPNPELPNRSRDSIIGVVHKIITTKQLVVDRVDKKLSFVVIRMEDNNEEFAKRFVELLAENAIKYYTEYKVKKAKQNYDVLKQQTDSVRNILFGNIENIAATNDLNVNPIKQRAKTGTQKTQVSSTVNAALYTELVKQLGLAQVNLQRETPLIQIIDKPVLPLKKIKPGRLFTGITYAFIGCFLAIVLLIAIKFKPYLIGKN